MHREEYTELTPVVGIGAAVLSADNTPAAVDLQGFDNATLLFDVGIGGITFSAVNKVEFVVTHSDDDSTYTAVTDDDVIGVTGVTGGIVYSLTAAQAAATVTKIGYRGGKRYLKVLADFSGTHGTGTPMAVTVVKGGPHYA